MGVVVLRDFVRGTLRLLAAVDELGQLTLLAQSAEGDRTLTRIALELTESYR